MTGRPEEIATLVVNGQTLKNWQAVNVRLTWGGSVWREGNFSLVEGEARQDLPNYRVKPGDEITCYLAGQRVIQGFVYLRQAAFDAHRRGVAVQVVSQVVRINESSVITKSGQFRGYDWSQIAKKVCSEVGVNLQMKCPPGEKFKDVQVIPGEKGVSLLNRLARSREIVLSDDEQGNLVADNGSNVQAAPDALIEGVNILSARCIIRDDFYTFRVVGLGQTPGDDERNGKRASQISATATHPNFKRPTTHVIVAERPMTEQELVRRVRFEMSWREHVRIECEIVVQGWLSPSGKLWDYNKTVFVRAPSLLLNQNLVVRSISFNQDNTSGTTTTIVLVPRQFLPSAVNLSEGDVPLPGVDGPSPNVPLP